MNGAAQSVGHHSAKEKVASWTPGQGAGLGRGLGPWSGCAQWMFLPHILVSLPLLSPFLPLSLKVNKVLKKHGKVTSLGRTPWLFALVTHTPYSAPSEHSFTPD